MKKAKESQVVTLRIPHHIVTAARSRADRENTTLSRVLLDRACEYAGIPHEVPKPYFSRAESDEKTEIARRGAKASHKKRRENKKLSAKNT